MGKKTYSGFPGDCSPEQENALVRFRQTVKDLGCTDPKYDDVYLLRFLRARKFDLKLTTEMWKNHIQWRADRKVDSILDVKFPRIKEAKQFYPHAYFRTDKLGRPIYIERVGYLKMDHLTKIMSHDELETYFIQSYERLMNQIFPACSKAAGKPINQSFYIIDLKNAGAKMMSPKMWEILKMASKIGSDYYPEILGTMFIVNAPLFFYGVWNIIKGFVDEKTRNKIHICGSGYKKELMEYVDKANLPDFLGGDVTVKDYGEGLTNEQGPWTEVPVEKSVAIIRPEPQIAITNNIESADTTSVVTGQASLQDDQVKDNSPVAKDVILLTEGDWAFPDIPEEIIMEDRLVRTFLVNVNELSQHPCRA